MKKYGFIAAIAAVAIAGVVGWNLLRGRDDSMASSIPADATMVGRVDLKKFVLDYGLDLADLKELFFSAKDGEETGIKYQTAAYFFSSLGKLGLIVPLSDEDDYEALLKRQGVDIEEQRGMKWSVLNGNMLMAFDDDRAMIMGPAVGSDQDALRNTIYTCMKQKSSDSGKQSRIYKLLDERDEPIALSTNFDALPEEFRPKPMKYLPKNISLGALDLMAGLSARKDKVSLNIGLSSADEGTNRVLDKYNHVVDKIQGSLVETTPPNALFHLEMGLDGDDLLEILRENKLLRTALLAVNMVIDLDKILKSIDGDISLTCLDFNGHDAPDLLFQADLDSDDFMKNVADWNDVGTRAMGINFYSQDKHNAVCTISGTPIYFGTRNKRLAISNQESLVKAEAHADVLQKFASDMKGNRIYGFLSIDKLRPMLGQLSPEADEYLGHLDRLTLSVPDSRQMHVDLVLSEGTDLLKLLKEITEE
ncbi:MAG: DUF4836 family protein [Bacteroidaceae bacterium]|nr:DUF4836 family protein [Bacteroidaceae bacterium]